MPVSKTQIDRLGERLTEGALTESDLRLLDDYRRSFGEAYESVVQTITRRGQSPTGRPAKSTPSIVEKLRRESIRLSQIQDIAGCRVVVANIADQENFVAALVVEFPAASVTDRREKPSYGYRAVHIVVEMSQKPVEVQVRTSLQHEWAEVSEKSSDVLDPTIKYGGGSEPWKSFLASTSKSIAAYEEFERVYSKGVADHEERERAFMELWGKHTEGMQSELERSTQWMETSRADLIRLRNENASLLDWAVSWLEDLKGKKL